MRPFIGMMIRLIWSHSPDSRKRVDAARGYGEVDGAAATGASEAHVRAALENLHGESALRQGNCEQWTG